MRERRLNTRVQEENRVAVTILTATLAPELVDHTFFCPTADISKTGLRLCVYHPVPIGATMVLRIAFRKPLRSFKHEGRVAWVRSGGDFEGYPCALGIELTRLQEGAESLWLHMLERKESDTSEAPPRVDADDRRRGPGASSGSSVQATPFQNVAPRQ